MAEGADSRELAELYRRYAPAVHRRALSLVGNADEALDITQETFLAYHRTRDRLRGEAAPFTVLYQIATYQAVDRLRRSARWFGRLSDVRFSEDDDARRERELEASQVSLGEAGRVEAAQDLALLTRGEDQTVLSAAMLYFVEGYTTEEIGQVLDLSRKTVGKMLERFAERARKRHARLSREGAP